MTYQVLARKWRPRVFEEIVGQPHVVTALVNALESQRLHHAYLFTGTRGVGKTTLARILAKAINCETGITAHPCGKCRACTEIDAGRFVDLLEVDAATNTKVDEMRELLDTAQYMPVTGRFKVYIIDEVHMLSRHAFNSMLKTLEEPPEHVKFILATTDPQRFRILKHASPEMLSVVAATLPDEQQHVQRYHEFRKFELPLRGNDLEVPGGPHIAKALERTREAVFTGEIDPGQARDFARAMAIKYLDRESK